MATLRGFKRATIAVLDKDGNATDKKYVIEGKTDKGATTEFELSGLSKDPTKVYGSNILYYSTNKGVGEVQLKVNILDLPPEAQSAILGYEENTDGIVLIGEETTAPNCAIIVESNFLNGEPAAIALFKGTFAYEGEKASTDEDEIKISDADELTFTSVGKDIDGKRQHVGKANGDETVGKLKELTFPTKPATQSAKQAAK